MTDTDTLNLFAQPESLARDVALTRHEDTARMELRQARAAARQYGMENHGENEYGVPYSCTADNVRSLLALAPLDGRKNNWMGGVFMDRDTAGNRVWERSGRYITSRTPGSHANLLPVWVLTREYLRLTGAI